jgi:GMP synthase-like glutamine amidotransferase
MASSIPPAARVGVLLCDHIDDDVVAEGHADYPERYRRLLSTDAGEDRIRPIMFDLTAGEMPTDPGQCDAWLIGGSRLDAHGEDGFVADLVEFAAAARSADIPQVGICFGHQILARALGGAVTRADAWGVGVRTYQVHGWAPWIEHGPSQVAIVASHRDQVVALPPGAELVLAAPYCPIAGFRVRDLVFTVQGHPEFDTALSRSLTTRRREAIGDATADAALESLETAPDSPLVNGWIRRFLTAGR